MSDSELIDTQPNSTLPDTQPGSPAPVEHKKIPHLLVALIVVALIAIGLVSGYGSGLGQRYAAQDKLLTGQLDEQFQFGMKAFEAGKYDLARQYFDFIISKDSKFPGIEAAYADLLLHMQVTPTPVFTPTPVISPTPDMRGAQEVFDAALQFLNTNDWNSAITNLDTLRKASPAYRVAEVDGMYYMALRQRGVEKIISGCQNANLEGGIYDLTLAEHFVGTGNLDSYAESLRTYARFYIIGASYWNQDWLQAQNYFSQVMDAYPSMSDSSCMNATKRWYEATISLAQQLFDSGLYCDADAQYTIAFAVNDPYNAIAFPTATAVGSLCNGDGGGGGGGGGGGSGGTPTPGVTPVETPIPTAEATPTCDPLLGTPCP